MRRTVLAYLLLLTSCQKKDEAPAGTLVPKNPGVGEVIALPAPITDGTSPPFRLSGGNYELRVRPKGASTCNSTITLHLHNKSAIKAQAQVEKARNVDWPGMRAGVYVLTVDVGTQPCAYDLQLTRRS
ncbi:hypothetical protein [Deinococcus hopiensis]|uniref:hypothetical protein n=1 Tax=Deinococcus hopiensis TaxID=309885 RepID=UPI00111BD5A5|nr:hypothetical protein [Deinococcus hopiensis]